MIPQDLLVPAIILACFFQIVQQYKQRQEKEKLEKLLKKYQEKYGPLE